MPTLEDAIALAVVAHRGQLDKVGQPYILHPLSVMFRLHSETERITAILHDMVEDTRYTLGDLRKLGYAEQILQALDCLTRRPEESYEEFIARIRRNPLARRVKIADLEDNMDLQRLPELTDRDVERLRRYRRAWAQLQDEQEEQR